MVEEIFFYVLEAIHSVRILVSFFVEWETGVDV